MMPSLRRRSSRLAFSAASRHDHAGRQARRHGAGVAAERSGLDAQRLPLVGSQCQQVAGARRAERQAQDECCDGDPPARCAPGADGCRRVGSKEWVHRGSPQGAERLAVHEEKLATPAINRN
jgi:hypothetical protein